MHLYWQSVWQVHPVSRMPKSNSGGWLPSFGPLSTHPSTHSPTMYVTFLYPSREHPSKPQLYRHRIYMFDQSCQSSWGFSARAAGAMHPRSARSARSTSDRRIPRVVARSEQCRTGSRFDTLKMSARL